MKCPSCGQEIDSPDQKICQYCGVKIVQKSKTNQPSTEHSALDKSVYKKDKSKNIYTKYTKKTYYPFAIISVFTIMVSFMSLGFFGYLDFILGISGDARDLIGPVFFLPPVIISIIGLIIGVIAGGLRIKWEKNNERDDKFGNYFVLIVIILNLVGIVIGVILMVL